jgi:hypothetical protein
MKSQKDVDIFFLKQDALLRQRQKESGERHINKGVRDLNKTPEEIRQLAQHAKEMCLAEKGKRMEAKEEQQKERKEAVAKEELAKKYAQGTTIRLHNRFYKLFLHAKRPKGKTVDRKHE